MTPPAAFQTLIFVFFLLTNSLFAQVLQVDYWIQGGTIVDGTGQKTIQGDIGLSNDTIVFVGKAPDSVVATELIDATGMLIWPGLIDPHTHSLEDIEKKSKGANLNYLTQGVTTVFNGNDGGGTHAIQSLSNKLHRQGIGTNTAFFVGHGSIRRTVMGLANRPPDSAEMVQMKSLVQQGMDEGAYGFSTGLYYAPGSYASTEEIIALTQEIVPYEGVYESHIRDESSYNIGLLNSVRETLEIGKKAGVPVHFAHIKALGVDVWGYSDSVIYLIEQAQREGQLVTADQYPWRASGTRLQNALISRWVMAGSDSAYYARLRDTSLLPQIKTEMVENLRKRGGPASILITGGCRDKSWIGQTLGQIADTMQRSPIEAALLICRKGGARIASFNMKPSDLENFMVQPWVMTSSDGSTGHPRKYASYPQKYQVYVQQKQLLSLESFVYRSSGQVAETFGLEKRGKLRPGYYADVVIVDPAAYEAKANFAQPTELTTGVSYVWVNGQLVIKQGTYNGKRPGKVLQKQSF